MVAFLDFSGTHLLAIEAETDKSAYQNPHPNADFRCGYRHQNPHLDADFFFGQLKNPDSFDPPLNVYFCMLMQLVMAHAKFLIADACSVRAGTYQQVIYDC